MSSKPWYPWYPSNWRAKTAGLTAEQRGIYRELLDECYVQGGPIPADLNMLARVAGAYTESERKSLEMVVGAFFVRDGNRLLNRAVEREIDKGRELAERGREGGLSTQAKKRINSTTIEADALADGQAAALAKRQAEGVAKGQALQPQLQPHTTTTTTKTLPAASRKPAETAATWNAYVTAYSAKYGVDPVRNAKANSMLLQFQQRLGIDEAPHVAAFYLTHSRRQYVESKHPIELLLRDAEGLRTEWATNSRIGETQARQADRTQATGSVFQKLLEEVEHSGNGTDHHDPLGDLPESPVTPSTTEPPPDPLADLH